MADTLTAYREAQKAHLDKLKAAADPERVAAALGMRQAGGRWFCPVCQTPESKTPDLVLLDGGFYCHKGQHGGDLVELVQVAGRLDFKAAVAWLEAHTGIGRDGKPPRRVPHDRGQAGAPGRHLRPSWGASSRPQVERQADSAVLEDFLQACRPVEGAALEWLAVEREVALEVIHALRLRFCGHEYPDVLAALTRDHGADALLAAGLLKAGKGDQAPVGTFAHYHAKRAGFLVIPYLAGGRPVYVKARVPVAKLEAERRHLVRFLNPPGRPVQLYNVDCLADKPPQVWICEGESDTWAALTAGKAAVGSPGAGGFKPEWVELFRPFTTPAALDEERAAILEHEAHLSREEAERQAAIGPVRSTVFLVLDADEAGREGADKIAGLFARAGLPAPRRAELPPGTDLSEYLRQGRQGDVQAAPADVAAQ
jgi:hypothetical protein